MKKTISILTESTILGKIPIIFGKIDKAYKVHVKGLTFCSLPLTIHGPFLFFVFEKLPYMDLNHSIHVPSFHLYFITPSCSTKRPTAETVERLLLEKTGASSPSCTWKAECHNPNPNQFTIHKSQ